MPLPAIRNPLKTALQSGTPAYILSVRISRGPEIIGIAASSGHDALYVDLQHSPLTLETVALLCQGALHAGLTPLVRVPAPDAAIIGRVLDAGALGVIAPDIRCAADARRVVGACRPPPRGDRSMMNGGPQTAYANIPSATLGPLLDALTLVIVMIESPDGVAAAAEIAAVPGVDALFVGTHDLTAAMGIPGEYRAPALRDAYRTMIDGCRAAGKPLLIGGMKAPDLLAEYIGMGAARCYFTGTDAAFLADGARRQVAALQAMDKTFT